MRRPVILSSLRTDTCVRHGFASCGLTGKQNDDLRPAERLQTTSKRAHFGYEVRLTAGSEMRSELLAMEDLCV